MKRLALHQMTIAAPKVTRNPMKIKFNIDSSETDLSEKAKVKTFYSNMPVQMWGG